MQEYRVCAIVVTDEQENILRETVRPFLLRGQVKFHWKIEPERRRHAFLSAITNQVFYAIIVCDRSSSQRHHERQRRKTLELLYTQLEARHVTQVTLEARTPSQDRLDIAHIAGLKSAGLFRPFRLVHQRGGDEPILWISDVLLGAGNAVRKGATSYSRLLAQVSALELNTMGSG
jgi:hypothetical protein